MNNFDSVFSLLLSNGAVRCGAAFQTNPTLPGFPRIIAAAFPYLADNTHAPISRYARASDYHTVLPRLMKPAADALIEMGFHAEIRADISPVHEVETAVRCGIGVRGKNGLVIVPEYGSWVFLGFILTDAPIGETPPQVPSECLGCRACIRDCPANAISDSGIDAERCLSAVTQKKGGLTVLEQSLMRKTETLWGCDICQEVCPMNHGARLTDIPAFSHNLIRDLSPKDLSGLSNRTLSLQYPERAFTWRGAAVLKRNADILHSTEESEK